MRLATDTRTWLTAITLVFVAVDLVAEAPGQRVSLVEIESPPGSTLILRAGYRDAGTTVFPADRIRNKLNSRSATFAVTYSGFSPAAEAAFQHAVDIWEQLVTSPVEIRIDASWTALDPGLLGSARADKFWTNGVNTFPDALADVISGFDLAPGQPDILANFNSDLGAWYLGTDGNPPPGLFDLATVVLHEIAHGLGFAGLMSVDGGLGLSIFVDPAILASFAEDFAGNLVTDTSVYPDSSPQLAAVLQSGDVYFGGSNAVMANGGIRPELFAPSQWLDGSSFSHLDENRYPPGDPDSLMTPFLDPQEVVHDPGLIALCIFQDIGWMTDATCESQLGLSDLGDLVVPGFEVDMMTPGGATTQWSVVNQADAPMDIEIHYFGRQVSPTPLRIDEVTLAGHETFATDVGFDLSDLNVDPDGFARGLIVVNEAGTTQSDELEGDYFRIDPLNSFAAGDRMISTSEFCDHHHIRFLDFGSGSVLRILLNRPLGGVAKSFSMRIRDFLGNFSAEFDYFTNNNLLVLNLEDLVAIPFGSIEFDFSAASGGVATARYSAFGQFSVELNSACRD